MKAFIGLIFDAPGNNNDINTILTTKNAQNPAYEWVECVGQELLASDHPIAAQYLGVVNLGGVNKIIIPDLRGKVTAGIGINTDSAGEGKAITSGVEGTYKHKLIEDELPIHSHSGAFTDGSVKIKSGTSSVYRDDGQTDSTGGDEPHNNIQPTVGTYKILLLDKFV